MRIHTHTKVFDKPVINPITARNKILANDIRPSHGLVVTFFALSTALIYYHSEINPQHKGNVPKWTYSALVQSQRERLGSLVRLK